MCRNSGRSNDPGLLVKGQRNAAVRTLRRSAAFTTQECGGKSFAVQKEHDSRMGIEGGLDSDDHRLAQERVTRAAAGDRLTEWPAILMATSGGLILPRAPLRGSCSLDSVPDWRRETSQAKDGLR